MGIEIESAGLAAQRRNPSQDAAIHEAYYEFDRLLSLDQATGKTDFAFHRAIAEATNNPFYVEVLDALGSRTIPCDVTSPWGTDSVLTRDYQEGLQVEHARIMNAISAGDTRRGADAMRAHLANSQERYRARLHQTTPKPAGRQLMAEHTDYESRWAIDSRGRGRSMGTDELRDNFLIEGLFAAGKVTLCYAHYDRMIVGGAVPTSTPLVARGDQADGHQGLPRPARTDRGEHWRGRNSHRRRARPLRLAPATWSMWAWVAR